MGSMLNRTALFLGLIILGFILKKIGLIGPRGKKFLQILVLRVTLPATIIYGFGDFHPDNSLFILPILGFVGNWLMMGIAFMLTRNQTREAKIFYVLNISGYNIGCFGLPFAQSIFGPSGIVATCMFDLGNSIMSTGGTYAFLKSIYPPKDAPPQTGHPLWGILKNLVSSVPFDAYTIMLIMALSNIPVPKFLLTITAPFASVNGYFSMFLLGVMLNLDLNAEKLRTIKEILITRFSVGILLALIYFFLLPVGRELKLVLMLAMFSPITVIASIFIDNLEGNGELASLATSVSIIISILLMIGSILFIF